MPELVCSAILSAIAVSIRLGLTSTNAIGVQA
jgi:hypothetical protein